MFHQLPTSRAARTTLLRCFFEKIPIQPKIFTRLSKKALPILYPTINLKKKCEFAHFFAHVFSLIIAFGRDAPDATSWTLSRKTSIATSGHIRAHAPQPIQLSPQDSTGKYPMALEFLDIRTAPLGHTSTQRPQPLHFSASITMLPFAVLRYINCPPAGPLGWFLLKCTFASLPIPIKIVVRAAKKGPAEP